jgi:hypothetical protein
MVPQGFLEVLFQHGAAITEAAIGIKDVVFGGAGVVLFDGFLEEFDLDLGEVTLLLEAFDLLWGEVAHQQQIIIKNGSLPKD